MKKFISLIGLCFLSITCVYAHVDKATLFLGNEAIKKKAYDEALCFFSFLSDYNESEYYILLTKIKLRDYDIVLTELDEKLKKKSINHNVGMFKLLQVLAVIKQEQDTIGRFMFFDKGKYDYLILKKAADMFKKGNFFEYTRVAEFITKQITTKICLIRYFMDRHAYLSCIDRLRFVKCCKNADDYRLIFFKFKSLNELFLELYVKEQIDLIIESDGYYRAATSKKMIREEPNPHVFIKKQKSNKSYKLKFKLKEKQNLENDKREPLLKFPEIWTNIESLFLYEDKGNEFDDELDDESSLCNMFLLSL